VAPTISTRPALIAWLPAFHECLLEWRLVRRSTVKHFAKPGVAIVFGAFMLCAETWGNPGGLPAFAKRAAPEGCPFCASHVGAERRLRGLLERRDQRL
jgi:hypothetical protein